jgi:hypothetical protein
VIELDACRLLLGRACERIVDELASVAVGKIHRQVKE